jgi:hypothetical protein
MLKVGVVINNEINNHIVDATILATKRGPILDTRLKVKHGPPIQLSGVHVLHGILGAVLSTVDGCKDKGIGMQLVTIDGAAIGQLEKALPHLLHRTVNLVHEKDDAVITSVLEPIGRVPRGTVALDDRQTNKVALSHLRGTTLDNTLANALGKGVNSLTLADTVPSANKDGVLRVSDRVDERAKRLEINRHLNYSCVVGGMPNRLKGYYTNLELAARTLLLPL